MNVERYISSGILESYAVGAATPEEKKEVEDNAAAYPEIKSEIEKIEKTLNRYINEHSVTPPSYMKGKIISIIINKPYKEPAANDSASIDNEISPVLKLEWQPEPSHSYWSIAASILLSLSVAVNAYFIIESKNLKKDIASLNKTNTAMNDSLQTLSSGYQQVMNDMIILKDPMFKVIQLKGMKAAPDAKAMVFWCPADKKIYIEIEKLPEPPIGMQYQLWAFVNGKPVSEGILTMGNGLHRMPDIGKAQAFGVTLEMAGGSTTPTGELVVMGTI